jgi:hypothetical protein
MRSVLVKSSRENQNTVQLRMFRDFSPPENHAVYEIVEKCSRAGEATHDSMPHANCMLDT